MSQIVFFVLSVVALFGAFMVVFSKNPMHSVLYLIITFFAISGHFVALSASFLGIVNIIVYAGAIMVLFLYVIMLLNLNERTEANKKVWLKLASVISGGALMLVLVGAMQEVVSTPGANAPAANAAQIGTVAYLGKVLFGKFLLPFEITSVLFLTAMIGAVLLGKKEVDTDA